MNEIDKKINNLLEYLDIQKDLQRKGLYITKDGSESLTLIKIKVRKILGFDKQCSQCLQYKMKYDLSLIGNTNKEVCQECLEKILTGKQIFKNNKD